jgi:predicted adenine nucleotide alpha hydrolase (AANH) superfamily ATPase
MSRDLTNPLCSEAAKVIVVDAAGQPLSPCTPDKARRMLSEGRARLVSESPLTIQLPWTAHLRSRTAPLPTATGQGKRLLLHVCCGPCSTYSIRRLREQGFELTGFWYNPNIHPFAEHERRRECVRHYAEEVRLPMVWWGEYEMPDFMRAVAGHEAFRERCGVCYRLRLERTAQVAQQQGFHAFTTTLLISPYQQQSLIRSLGDSLADRYGVEFYFENLRKGWRERGSLTHQHGLYQQRYCGCSYSEREANRKCAPSAESERPIQDKGI